MYLLNDFEINDVFGGAGREYDDPCDPRDFFN